MNYLLDTHTIIWCFDFSSKLPKRITDIIENPEHDIYISSISLYEIAIKQRINKLKSSFTLMDLLYDIKTNGFKVLHIADDYLLKYIELPLIHSDPFDGLIIATALCEDLTLLTADEQIHQYDVKWMW